MEQVIAYTAIFGGYDELRPTDWPGACFTDGKVRPTNGWDCRVMLTDWPPKLASRAVKILAHRYIDAEYSMYIDGNRSLFTNPQDIVDKWLQDTDIAVFRHPEHRDCIYQEAEEVLRQHKAHPRRVQAQMERYRREGYPERNGLATCCIIARRNTEQVRAFNELWWHEYTNSAHRDQLSFNYVCWRLGMQYTEIPPHFLQTTNRTPHPRLASAPGWLADGEVLTDDERTWVRAQGGAIAGVGIDSGDCAPATDDEVHVIIVGARPASHMSAGHLDAWAARVATDGILIVRGYAPSPERLALVPELAQVRVTVDEWQSKSRWRRMQAVGEMGAWQRY